MLPANSRSKPGRSVRGRRRTWLLIPLCGAIVICGSQRPAAFKFETHVWVAQQVLNDIAQCAALNSGRPCVRIDFTDPAATPPTQQRTYFLDLSLASSLHKYPEAYRLGATGPDAFPDIAGGQMTTHPGVKGYMLADDWLKWVLDGASKPKFSLGGSLATGKTIRWEGSEQQAFALGYVAHAAGDVFAHSYVNTYAGDVFWLTDGEQEVETRHIALEAIIRDYTPPFTDASGHDLGGAQDIAFMPHETDDEKKARKSVFEYIAKRLILNPTVAHQYGLPDVMMSHLLAMHEVWSRQNQLLTEIESAKKTVDDKIGAVQGRIDALENFTITFGGCVDFGLFEVCTPVVSYKPYPSFCWVDAYVTCTLVNSLDSALSTLKSANTQFASDIKGEISDWHQDTEDAVTAYIETSEKVVKEIMKGEAGHPLTELNDWVNCYGPVFTHIDPLSRAITCPTIGLPFKAINFITSFCNRIGDVSQKLEWGACPMQQVKNFLEHQLLDSGFVTGVVAAIPGVTDNSMVTQMVRLRTQNGDTETDEGRLTDEFSSSTNFKNLLTVPDIVCRMRADMHLTEGDCEHLVRSTFDPARFNPVHDAIQLTKLTLLGPGELNRLVHEASIDHTIYGTDMYAPADSFNVLLDAVRSLDGNQQWQESPVKYPRRNTNAGGAPSAEAVTDAVTPFGRPFSLHGSASDGPTGFRLWQDCEARTNIFKQVFTGPVATGIENPAAVGLSEILLDGDPNQAGRLDPFPIAAGSILPTKVQDLNGVQHFVCGKPPIVTLPNRGSFTPVITPDTTPPTLTPPPDVTVECSANGAHDVNLGSPVVSDNRDSSPDVSDDAPDFFPYGNTTIRWHAVDAAGNATDREQIVHVVDRARPVFPSLPSLSVVANNPSGMPVSVPPPVASDSCDGPIPATQVQAESKYSLGAHTLFWQAQDRAGNVTIARQTVTVSARRGDLDVDGDVDTDDVNIVLASRNVVPAADLSLRDFDHDGLIDDADRAVYALLQAGNGDPRDVNHDGVIDVLDARIIVTLCTRPRCAVR